MNSDVTVVVMAAGLGTRMRSKHAKVLHKAGGQTLVEHVLDAAAAIAPPERTFAVIGNQAEQVRALLAPRGIGFIHQKEQLGTGHAVLCGREQLEALGGRLVVLNGDGPLLRAETLAELVQTAEQTDAAAVMIAAELEDPTGFGRIVRNPDGSVRAVVEQKAATAEQLLIRDSNTGQYCFNAPLFWKHVEELRPDNPAHEYYLTDMIEILIRAGYLVEPYRVKDVSEVLGINNRVELAAVDTVFRQRKLRDLMLSGVTVEQPETVTVHARVAVGMDTVVEPFVRLLGSTRIGENCRIGAHAVLTDAVVGDGVEILPFTVIEQATVADEARLGPFSRIRPESEVGTGAHIGNFVELKKAKVRPGVKAMHLSYLGDCTIGERTNIGAGTITCNYDGFHKHPTLIGADAFIGSNSTLVAPVEIENTAYVAAGSVITDHVPNDALALGRARQIVKEGWVSKRKETRKT